MAPTLTAQKFKTKGKKESSQWTNITPWRFLLWHIAHSTTCTRKTASVATYYVEEMKEAKSCMINNIK
jgi:hypothetical protein